MLKLDDNIKSKYGKVIKVIILQKKNDMYCMLRKIFNYFFLIMYYIEMFLFFEKYIYDMYIYV